MQNIHANLREPNFDSRLCDTSHPFTFEAINQREIMNLEYPTRRPWLSFLSEGTAAAK
jgi:hypothetical protein